MNILLGGRLLVEIGDSFILVHGWHPSVVSCDHQVPKAPYPVAKNNLRLNKSLHQEQRRTDWLFPNFKLQNASLRSAKTK